MTAITLTRRNVLSGGLATLLAACAGTGAGGGGPTLVAAGGGRMPVNLTQSMVSAARKRANKAIVITLGAPDPASWGRREAEGLRSYGIARTHVVSSTAVQPDLPARIADAGLVWFSGGLQNRYVQRLNAMPGASDAVRRMHAEGGVVGGSSAGAALQSRVMITGGRNGRVSMGRGLALWPEVIVDQHVIARNRQYRLRRAIAQNPSLVGVGIDEDTGVLATGGGFRVYGRSKVIVVRSVGGTVQETILSNGDTYTL